jgi:glycosyltransferase involved in cell wall biosynthesis
LDILKNLADDLHLVLVGDGPDRTRLEQFARAIGVAGQVHFLGNQPDVAALLALAEVVWVPGRVDGSVNVALEAMAAGRPVVASDLPGLAEVVCDGETGFLVPPGDKVALARQTWGLLEDAGRRRRLGDAGRARVRQHFAAEDMVRRWAALYNSRVA